MEQSADRHGADFISREGLSIRESMAWNTGASVFYLLCNWLTTVLVVGGHLTGSRYAKGSPERARESLCIVGLVLTPEPRSAQFWYEPKSKSSSATAWPPVAPNS